MLLVVIIDVARVVRYIPNARIGVVEKLWSSSGSVKSGLLALGGEAGFQPDVRRGGFHFFPPFQYRVHICPMVSVTQGKIGYVFARDGVDLPAGQTLADNATVNNFLDVRAFLVGGGQKGPQRKILREGTHIINPALFVVMTEEATYSMTMDTTERAARAARTNSCIFAGSLTPGTSLSDLIATAWAWFHPKSSRAPT